MRSQDASKAGCRHLNLPARSGAPGEIPPGPERLVRGAEPRPMTTDRAVNEVPAPAPGGAAVGYARRAHCTAPPPKPLPASNAISLRSSVPESAGSRSPAKTPAEILTGIIALGPVWTRDARDAAGRPRSEQVVEALGVVQRLGGQLLELIDDEVARDDVAARLGIDVASIVEGGAVQKLRESYETVPPGRARRTAGERRLVDQLMAKAYGVFEARKAWFADSKNVAKYNEAFGHYAAKMLEVDRRVDAELLGLIDCVGGLIDRHTHELRKTQPGLFGPASTAALAADFAVDELEASAEKMKDGVLKALGERATLWSEAYHDSGAQLTTAMNRFNAHLRGEMKRAGYPETGPIRDKSDALSARWDQAKDRQSLVVDLWSGPVVEILGAMSAIGYEPPYSIECRDRDGHLDHKSIWGIEGLRDEHAQRVKQKQALANLA